MVDTSYPAFMATTKRARRASDAQTHAMHGQHFVDELDETTARGWSDGGSATSGSRSTKCAAIANATFERLAARAIEARAVGRVIDIPDDALDVLAWLYGAKHLHKALEVIQAGRVKRVVGEKSGRVMYAVTGSGSHEAPYLCFPSHFCTCRSFFWECVSRGEALACKHQLAARLASVLGACASSTVDDLLLGNMMMKYMSTST